MKASIISPTLRWALLLMWIVKLWEVSLGTSWHPWGLYPQDWNSWYGIFTSPFLHGDFSHLFSNSLSLLVLGGLVFSLYPKEAHPLSIWLILAGGIWTWIFARPSYHIGASGVIYGYASYLFFVGILTWQPRQLAITLFMTFAYSGMLAGLVPQGSGISWEGHLSGCVAGLVYSIYYYQNLRKEPKPMRKEVVQEKEAQWKIRAVYYREKEEDQEVKVFPK